MRKHRWVWTRFMRGGGFEATFKYGTTLENVGFSILYAQPKDGALPMVYRSPELPEPITKELHIDYNLPPEEINKQLWAALQAFEKECVAKVAAWKERIGEGTH